MGEPQPPDCVGAGRDPGPAGPGPLVPVTVGAGAGTAQAPGTTAPAGRYEILGLLGSGGMGHVYRARDGVLGREVALKVIRHDDPSLAERLLHEARAQARVEHPNICKVFDSGLQGDRPFIAMQLVRGPTLSQAARGMSLEQKVEVVRLAAEALHAAHREGLIHRDVKPSNVLVERAEDGRWVPYVTDFGLVHEEAAISLTAPGMVVGTPQYMAPEQARSQPTDRRTDVYGLGATLYELVTGTPPFPDGPLVEVVRRVVHEDPVPARRLVPSLPEDLAAILGTCLAKEPGKRYESARALAADLGRYLDGEPVAARPAGLVCRLRRKAAKHRAVVALGALLLASGAVFLGLLARGRWVAREQTILAAELAGEIQGIELILRSARLAPLHDLRPELATARGRLERLELTLVRGSWAAGPGHHALGRGRLALGDLDTARDHLEKAWAAGYRGPTVAHALGLTLGRLFERELAKAERIADDELRVARRRELEAAFREPAVRYLGGAVDPLGSPALLQALVALHQGRFDAALAGARQASREARWLHEAHLLEGDVLMARGRAAVDRGDASAAAIDFRMAAAPYAAAAEMARSDPDVHLAECGRLLALLRLEANPGPPRAETRAALTAACGRAAEADPGRPEVPRFLAEAQLRVAMHELYTTRADPRPSLEGALDLARRAIAADPADAGSRVVASEVLAVIAVAEGDRGVDPRPRMRAGLELAREAIALDPRLAWAYLVAGKHRSNLATVERLREGTPPEAELARAAEDLRRAVALEPRLARPHIFLGNIHFGVAMSRRAAGEDPRPGFAAAIAEYRRALALDPDELFSAANLAEATEGAARWTLREGGDPRAELEAALAEVRLAGERNPAFAPVPLQEGALHGVLAELEVRAGRDPTAELERGRRAVRRAIELQPERFLGSLELGILELVAVRWQALQRRPARAELAAARQALDHSLELNPASSRALAARAELRLEEARLARAAGRDPGGPARSGLADVERALALEVRDAGLARLRDELQREAGPAAGAAR